MSEIEEILRKSYNNLEKYVELGILKSYSKINIITFFLNDNSYDKEKLRYEFKPFLKDSPIFKRPSYFLLPPELPTIKEKEEKSNSTIKSYSGKALEDEFYKNLDNIRHYSKNYLNIEYFKDKFPETTDLFVLFYDILKNDEIDIEIKGNNLGSYPDLLLKKQDHIFMAELKYFYGTDVEPKKILYPMLQSTIYYIKGIIYGQKLRDEALLLYFTTNELSLKSVYFIIFKIGTFLIEFIKRCLI